MLFLVSHAIPNLAFEQREKEREGERASLPNRLANHLWRNWAEGRSHPPHKISGSLSEKNFKSPRICTTPASAYQKSIYFVLHNLRNLSCCLGGWFLWSLAQHTQYPSPCSRCVVREASQTAFVADLKCTVKHPKSLPNIMILIQDIFCVDDRCIFYPIHLLAYLVSCNVTNCLAGWNTEMNYWKPPMSISHFMATVRIDCQGSNSINKALDITTSRQWQELRGHAEKQPLTTLALLHIEDLCMNV